MSLTLKENLEIQITQGDTAILVVGQSVDGEHAPFIDGEDQVDVIVKKKTGGDTAIHKTVTTFTTEGYAEVIFEGSDTSSLRSGYYIYTITNTEVSSGDVATIIPGSGSTDNYPQFRIIPVM